jgi:hypothetical protein
MQVFYAWQSTIGQMIGICACIACDTFVGVSGIVFLTKPGLLTDLSRISTLAGLEHTS